MENPLSSIHEAKQAGQLYWTHHALRRSEEKDITAEDVKAALNSPKAEILRNYPTEESPFCLILGWDSKDRPIHAVVAYAKMLMVTIYEPKLPKWRTPYERG